MLGAALVRTWNDRERPTSTAPLDFHTRSIGEFDTRLDHLGRAD